MILGKSPPDNPIILAATLDQQNIQRGKHIANDSFCVFESFSLPSLYPISLSLFAIILWCDTKYYENINLICRTFISRVQVSKNSACANFLSPSHCWERAQLHFQDCLKVELLPKAIDSSLNSVHVLFLPHSQVTSVSVCTKMYRLRCLPEALGFFDL